VAGRLAPALFCLYRIPPPLVSCRFPGRLPESYAVKIPVQFKVEHVGVKPDVLLLPNAKNLGAGRAPVMSYAATLLGVTLDPAKPAELAQFEWGN
jgi:hypothetical protein